LVSITRLFKKAEVDLYVVLKSSKITDKYSSSKSWWCWSKNEVIITSTNACNERWLLKTHNTRWTHRLTTFNSCNECIHTKCCEQQIRCLRNSKSFEFAFWRFSLRQLAWIRLKAGTLIQLGLDYVVFFSNNNSIDP